MKQTDTEIWDIKSKVRARDNYCCGRCGMTEKEHRQKYPMFRSINGHIEGRELHVHRLTPDSLYSMEGCITLCHGCHSAAPEHRHRKGDEHPMRQRALAIRDKGTPLQTYVPDALKDAMSALADRNRRTLTGEVILALENHLAANGVTHTPDATPAESPAPKKPRKRKGE